MTAYELPPEPPTGVTARTTCAAATTRQGEEEPCGKPAVTWAEPAYWVDDEGWPQIGRPWPVCAYHAHMGKALPLDQHPKETP